MIKDEDDTLIVEISLRSQRFSSRIEIPLMSSDAEKKKFIDQWLMLMEAGIRCGQSAREAKKKLVGSTELAGQQL